MICSLPFSLAQLSGMPLVRRFVKEEGHADSYENLEVVYLKGRTPDLVLYDDNDIQIGRHALARLTTEQIHELVQELGFKRKPGSRPLDEL